VAKHKTEIFTWLSGRDALSAFAKPLAKPLAKTNVRRAIGKEKAADDGGL
jgi:hypothetical protein